MLLFSCATGVLWISRCLQASRVLQVCLQLSGSHWYPCPDDGKADVLGLSWDSSSTAVVSQCISEHKWEYPRSPVLLSNALMLLIAHSLLWRNPLPFPFLPCFREFLYPLASLTNSFYPLKTPFPPSLCHNSCHIREDRDSGPWVQQCEPLGAGARMEEWSPPALPAQTMAVPPPLQDKTLPPHRDAQPGAFLGVFFSFRAPAAADRAVPTGPAATGLRCAGGDGCRWEWVWLECI